MTDQMNIITHASGEVAVRPTPRISITVREATASDLSFLDMLQKMHSHMVGWMPRKQLEKYLELDAVLIAQDHQDSPLGYCIARDQYMKRDDVGIVYQLNVVPLRQRNLVGAALLKATFDRAAYGCKLFSCWCAQDIQANWFWESCGFIPLAFRTGSRAKQRTHIFWQRRIRDNDTATPYWFPSQTSAGAVGEDRIVLPIPPGTHWRDAKPLVLPDLPPPPPPEPELPELLPGGQRVRPRQQQPKIDKHARAVMLRANSKHLGGVPAGMKAVIRGGRIKYVPIPGYVAETDAPDEFMDPRGPKPKGEKKPRHVHDPKYLRAARDLRDRYLEEMNNSPALLPAAHGKYDVSRQLEARGEPPQIAQLPRLEAA